MVYAKEGVLARSGKHPAVVEIVQRPFEERDKQDPRELTKIRQGIEVTEGVFPFPSRNSTRSI